MDFTNRRCDEGQKPAKKMYGLFYSHVICSYLHITALHKIPQQKISRVSGWREVWGDNMKILGGSLRKNKEVRWGWNSTREQLTCMYEGPGSIQPFTTQAQRQKELTKSGNTTWLELRWKEHKYCHKHGALESPPPICLRWCWKVEDDLVKGRVPGTESSHQVRKAWFIPDSLQCGRT